MKKPRMGKETELMKRLAHIVGILAAALILAGAVGCKNDDTGQKNQVFIEDGTWKLSTVQSGDNGDVTACSKENAASYPDAEEVTVNCGAKDGNFTITDVFNDKTYAGTYEIAESSSESTVYEIMVGNETGRAVAAATEYHDGSKRPTLIMTIGGDTLNFYSE